MSLVVREMQSHAAQIQQRLRKPPNAVRDVEIDLSRPTPGMERRLLRLTPPEQPKVPPKKIIRATFVPADTATRIIRIVAQHYGLTHADLVGRSRTAPIVGKRHLAVFLIRNITDMSWHAIARRMGGRDHSTSINSYNVVAERLEREAGLVSELSALERKVREKLGLSAQ